MDQNYYDILGVKRDATEDEIKRAFKKKCVRMYPNKYIEELENKFEDNFKVAHEAYEVLINPRKRKIYDLEGMNGLKTLREHEFNSEECSNQIQ